MQNRLDKLGMAISSLCLLHCLAVPVGAALLPMMSHGLALPEWLHLMLLSAALPVAASALWQGWRRHGRMGIAMLGAGGLALLGAGPDVPRGRHRRARSGAV
ncbi:MAG: MerC domain-containing protein [Sphingopyxis sp.]|nr:MerC domain-containing protein [Sphingopyxis sp.]